MVALKSEKDSVALAIEDNGIGFHADDVAKGIGLDSMKERLATMNGTLNVSSQKSRGTRVVATVRRS
jgi:signal transduction histidine kinase